MGATFSDSWKTADDVVAHVIQSISKWRIKEDGDVKVEVWACFAYKRVGNVVWSVWCEQNGSLGKVLGKEFIQCDLLLGSKKTGWGYKSMVESMHPYVYTCPLRFLSMAPEACEEWREQVREHHKALKTKVSTGEIVGLRKGYQIQAVKIVEGKSNGFPIHGVTSDGKLIKLRKSHLSGKKFSSWGEVV